ncbi:MAG: asparagine synthase (glutamine-hydrolyzing) [Burkholderiaceae bacterium]
MCGIAGILRLTDASVTPRREELEAMIAALRHRGPDGNGVHLEDPVGLAHSRLSIIDLAGGAQPIHNETQDVWVTFNGEIFNHIELRRELERQGHRFYTRSDTEVIVHLYEQHGESFVDHLNGQFAIGLWDRRLKRLVLARDRVGIRPLFYTQTGGRLLFASEVKALFQLPEVTRRLDPMALSQIFSVWSTIGERTVFDGVKSLPPGHTMTVEPSGIRIRRYWDWSFASPDDPAPSEADCAAELKELLIDCVRLQLRADVPVGAYLSGGLDSSVITSLIRNHTDTPLRSFSLTFEDAEFDESAYQRSLADHLGTEHSSLRVNRSDIAAAFPRVIWHTESPIVRTAPTPLMLLSEHVRQSGYKVVLTGEGADEVFGGYDLFKEAKVRRFMARSPHSKWRGRILERLYPYLKNSPVSGSALAQRFFAEGIEHLNEPWFAHHTRIRTTQRTLQFLRPEVQDRIASWDPCQALRDEMPADSDRWCPMGRDQYIEAHTLMSGYLLSSQGDRVAMANSVEGRVPFLDHRLIEFANRLPPGYKLHGLTEKYLLKRAVQGEVPDLIRNRTKQPYRAPDSASFFVDGRPVEYVAELLSPSRIDAAGLFDSASVTKLVGKCQAGRAIGFGDNMAFVGILSTMLLHDQFVKPAAVGPASH